MSVVKSLPIWVRQSVYALASVAAAALRAAAQSAAGGLPSVSSARVVSNSIGVAAIPVVAVMDAVTAGWHARSAAKGVLPNHAHHFVLGVPPNAVVSLLLMRHPRSLPVWFWVLHPSAGGWEVL